MTIKAARGGSATIRTQLGRALAIALLPVLALGVVQAFLAFGEDAGAREAGLRLAAERSAITVHARIEAGSLLLRTLSMESVGLNCAQRLAEVRDRVPGYVNLVRFDRIGRIVCAAGDVPQDFNRRDASWFVELQRGEKLVVARPTQGEFGPEAGVLAGTPILDSSGAFDGALVAVINLNSLQPDIGVDRSLPTGTAVAFADGEGRFFAQSADNAFASPPAGWTTIAAREGLNYIAAAPDGRQRAHAASALVGDDLFVLLSAPIQSAGAWAQTNLMSNIVPPILAFVLALAAVWVVSEQVVIRWLNYLQRIAAIYARGRFTVRPVKADAAPPEIREFAETLDIMADAIVARDHSLRESLAHKDGLMREIHHRVKNNLQVISSLISMQQRALADPAARAAMHDTRQRITALALVYRALYEGPDLRQVDLRGFLEDLIAQLLGSDAIHGHSVRTAISVDELVIDPDKLAPLALFAVEAISNAQKHAFAGRGGKLTVRFKVDGDRARLEIANDGEGGAALGAGVGRTLMQAFARQLGGEATFEPNDQGGLTARLDFPAPGEAPGDPSPQMAKTKRNQAAA